MKSLGSSPSSRRHDWRDSEGDPDTQRCYRCGMLRRTKHRWRGKKVWTMGYCKVRFKPRDGKWFTAMYVPGCEV